MTSSAAASARPASRVVALGRAAAFALAGCLIAISSGHAQGVRVGTVVTPDTILVGQPFRVGVTVETSPDARVRFPAALELPDDLEQVAPVRVAEEESSPGRSRAYYQLVAWTDGEFTVPPIPVAVFSTSGEEADASEVLARPPRVLVQTVLPDGIQDLRLRQALPYLRTFPFPWILLVLLALLAALWAYRRWRRGHETEEAAPVLTAWERALEELEQLAESWRAGSLTPDGFFDRLEAILRRYLAVTESWRPGVPVRTVVDGDQMLAEALRRSARVRFARLAGGNGGPLQATDACEAWIVGRHDAEEAQGVAGNGDVAAARASRGEVSQDTATAEPRSDA